jgi:hypothetical protein
MRDRITIRRIADSLIMGASIGFVLIFACGLAASVVAAGYSLFGYDWLASVHPKSLAFDQRVWSFIIYISFAIGFWFMMRGLWHGIFWKAGSHTGENQSN